MAQQQREHGRTWLEPRPIRRHRLLVVHRRAARSTGSARRPLFCDRVLRKRPFVSEHVVHGRRVGGRPADGLCTRARATYPALQRTISPVLAVYNIVNIYMTKMTGVSMITTSTVAIYTGFAPRWLAILGYALALLVLFGSYQIAWSFVVFPVWVLTMSAHIYLIILSTTRNGGEGLSLHLHFERISFCWGRLDRHRYAPKATVSPPDNFNFAEYKHCFTHGCVIVDAVYRWLRFTRCFTRVSPCRPLDTAFHHVRGSAARTDWVGCTSITGNRDILSFGVGP